MRQKGLLAALVVGSVAIYTINIYVVAQQNARDQRRREEMRAIERQLDREMQRTKDLELDMRELEVTAAKLEKASATEPAASHPFAHTGGR